MSDNEAVQELHRAIASLVRKTFCVAWKTSDPISRLAQRCAIRVSLSVFK